jgi:thiosulfate reductase cytochrome b subunit
VQVIHPRAVRVMHWTNAAATIVMIMSGLQIHNADPILPFAIPAWMTLGGWLGGALLWHFAAMWVLAVNGLAYLAYGFLSGRFRRRLLPLSPSALFADLREALQGRLVHADLSAYNAVQKFSYVFVIVMLVLVVASGIALWKPVQFHALAHLLGDFDNARIVHFVAMAAILGFLLLHVVMSLLVPRSLLAMIRGRA